MQRAETRARVRALQLLYAWDLSGRPSLDTVIARVAAIYEERPTRGDRATELAGLSIAGVHDFDRQVSTAAEHWRLERVGVVERNILRLALAELAEGATRTPLARVDEMPMTVGGAARHNVANALAAAAGAWVLGVPPDVIGRELRRFGRAASDNEGRANMVELGGVQLVIDYAHNPHGLAALGELMAALPARRRLVLIGQAGDRPDGAIRALARAAFSLRPDRVVLKEMERYLRGRRPRSRRRWTCGPRSAPARRGWRPAAAPRWSCHWIR